MKLLGFSAWQLRFHSVAITTDLRVAKH